MHADRRNMRVSDARPIGSNKYAVRNSDSREIQAQSGPVCKMNASQEEAIKMKEERANNEYLIRILKENCVLVE